MTIQELDTPSIVVDLNILESNLRRMAEYCRAHKLNLRPHTKTHKSPDVARLQVAQGPCLLRPLAAQTQRRVADLVPAAVDDFHRGSGHQERPERRRRAQHHQQHDPDHRVAALCPHVRSWPSAAPVQGAP